MRIGIGIDTGGTCTDAVAYDLDAKKLLAKGKALTTHSCLEVGIGKALDTLPQELIAQAERVALSTTLATNACLEDMGSRCRLVIFGQTEEMVRHLKIDEKYGIPLNHVLCVDTHGSADGLRIDVPDWDEFFSKHSAWLSDAEVLACSELYSASNGAPCEKAFKKLTVEKLGVKSICASELTDEINVIARGATAMLNARLLPIINDFISAILHDLEKRGCKASISVVRSDGSMMNAASTLDKPVETILSGPAASVLAGEAFYDGENYLTVDMGGTTTDVSVVIGGKPTPAQGGIRLGHWRTVVQGVFAAPFALGGDTHIWMDDRTKTLSLGVRRVKSLCSTAVEWPEIKDMLRRIVNVEHKHINRFPLHEVIYLQHRPERTEMYNSYERRLLAALEDGPMLLEDLESRAGLDIYDFSMERLESEGIIMRCGLTPTDFMHIKGDYNGYDREASVLAARYLLAALGREDTEEELMKLCDEVYETVEERMYCNLVHVLLRQLYPGQFEDGLDPQMEMLIRRTWQTRNSPKHPFLCQQFETGMALVGVGAPIHIFLPEVARALGARCILSENHDVANALGALQAKLNATVRVGINQMLKDGAIFYVAHLPDGAVRYDHFSDAVEAAKKAAAKIAVEEARKRGAVGELVPEVRVNRTMVRDEQSGRNLPIGTVVEAEITQRA